MIIGSKKIALIQLGYIGAEGISKVLILQVYQLNNLPSKLIALLEDTSFSILMLELEEILKKLVKISKFKKLLIK